MTNFMEHLSVLLGIIIFKNSIEDYATTLLTFFVIFLGFSITRRILVDQLGKLAAKTTTDFDDFCVTLVSQVGWPSFGAIALYMATSGLILPEIMHTIIRYAMIFVITIRAILLFQEVVQYGVSKAFRKRLGGDNASSKAMINGAVWVIKWGIWVLGAVFILDNLGVNISSLVAGIGIGGIAVAMASQAVLGDAFSALSIYLDKPFEIGDFIIIDESMGTVEHIGLKTTRIRSLSGEQMVFSNSDLTKSRVKNYKRMQTRRIVFKIGIVYQTPLEKVEAVPEMIKEVLTAQDVRIERVHFLSMDDYALTYEIAYHVSSADYNVYMDKQQAINLGIMHKFEEEGIQFAYPTQTLYLSRT